MTNEKTGRCLCGSVTVKTNAPTEEFGVCHCEMCRRWAGGPYFEFPLEDNVKFEGSEHIATYSSSDWAERGFCKNCGSHIYYRLKVQNHYHVSIGLFADSTDPELVSQVFIDRKPKGYSFSQKTKDYTEKEIFEMFGDG